MPQLPTREVHDPHCTGSGRIYFHGKALMPSDYDKDRDIVMGLCKPYNNDEMPYWTFPAAENLIQATKADLVVENGRTYIDYAFGTQDDPSTWILTAAASASNGSLPKNEVRTYVVMKDQTEHITDKSESFFGHRLS